jgi:Iap family predicted aminopeptidase
VLRLFNLRFRHVIEFSAAAILIATGLIPYRMRAQETSVQFDLLQPDLIEERLRRSSLDNTSRESNLKALFQEAGCAKEKLVEQEIKREKIPNVICTLPGASDSVILIGAHFDHVRVGDGVVDNWSGAGLLPSLFESLKGIPRKHTLVFVGFAAEEEGLVGSTFYANQLSPQQIASIRVMVNMDSLGLGPTRLWLSHSDKELASKLGAVANAMKLPFGVVDADRVGDEDSTPFRKRHVPTVMLHSITQETLSVIHTGKDNLSAIRADDYYDSYHLIAEYLAYLDARLE